MWHSPPLLSVEQKRFLISSQSLQVPGFRLLSKCCANLRALQHFGWLVQSRWLRKR
jgi:hypothetical protein